MRVYIVRTALSRRYIWRWSSYIDASHDWRYGTLAGAAGATGITTHRSAEKRASNINIMQPPIRQFDPIQV